MAYNQKTTLRDYDNTPIIIKDHNSSFPWLTLKYTGFPLMIIVFIIYPLIMEIDIKINYIVLAIIAYPLSIQYKKSKDRKIVLSKDTIKYNFLEEKLSEIDLSKPFEFFISFQNYYHKSQNLHLIYFIFIYLFIALLMKSFINAVVFVLFTIVLVFTLEQITKYIISDTGFKFFSFVLVKQGEEIVSIPIFKKQDYVEVKEYLMARGIVLENLPIFFKPYYGSERKL